MMKSNIGKTDQIIRLALAAAIAIIGFYYQSWLGFLAIIPLLTGSLSYCPLYSLLGISTCKTAAGK